MRGRRLRPARLAAREALVRRRRPLQPRGRAARCSVCARGRATDGAVVEPATPRADSARGEPDRPTAAIPAPQRGLGFNPCATRSRRFTPEEEAVLRPHFTNLDRPVFCLVNLPETVKGALFARYSRYPGTARRLFLEEFAGRRAGGRAALRRDRGRARGGAVRARLHGLRRRLDRPGGRRAPRLRVGLERPHQGPAARTAGRLSGAVHPLHPLRPADAGRWRLPLLPRRARSASRTGRPWTSCSGSTPAASSPCSPGPRSAGRAARSPRPHGGARSGPRPSTCCAGVLPAATLSHVGIFASGQAYEQLLLRLMASPLPEAREFGGMILEELGKVIPSFVARVERPDRGGEWIAYLRERRRATERAVGQARARPPERRRRALGRAGRRRRRRGGAARGLAVRVRRRRRRRRSGGRIEALDPLERAELIAELAGERREPAPPPGPRLGGGSLPVRDRLRLRRLPRPPAAPDADLPVAAARAGPGRRDPGGGPRGRGRARVRAGPGAIASASSTGSRREGSPTPRRTRSASATGSDTCST